MLPALRILLAVVFVGSTSPASAQTSACSFMLGFAVLANLTPEVVGDCVSAERFNSVNGETSATHHQGPARMA